MPDWFWVGEGVDLDDCGGEGVEVGIEAEVEEVLVVWMGRRGRLVVVS